MATNITSLVRPPLRTLLCPSDPVPCPPHLLPLSFLRLLLCAPDITNGVNGTGEFHNNFFFILNLAIGGNWPGFNIDNGAFPAYMYVDYVRVYQ
jgi:hypothetical protein